MTLLRFVLVVPAPKVFVLIKIYAWTCPNQLALITELKIIYFEFFASPRVVELLQFPLGGFMIRSPEPLALGFPEPRSCKAFINISDELNGEK